MIESVINLEAGDYRQNEKEDWNILKVSLYGESPLETVYSIFIVQYYAQCALHINDVTSSFLFLYICIFKRQHNTVC